ncbi:fatty acyl-AMP ligase [Kitasatospora kifunensis]|uniref:Acyl-CoA synthetase (AMP-forming)/AMP-acid ligase II n=1 Tax=Kitasatospora kifunensis TaxID=58351 RepID=A0A7W7R3L4_KITKI|nr:fatty acyl-AMP ligase [Kitasatospora kifunensis]MBB4924858.1 acyl-CoA synthetase (AMP-forming)/AMP-acid ligase II [Kitasatospora kifunensis]
MARAHDFTELLLRRGEQLAGHEAYRFVRGDESAPGPAGAQPSQGVSVSYGELDLAAKGIAARLQQGGPPGQRVVLCHGDSEGFLPAFLGALYAGAIPVPAPAPSGTRQCEERLARILRDTAANQVLTDVAHGPVVSQLLAKAGQSHLPCLATDLPNLGDPAAWVRPPARPDGPAFLQYTSGSVSEPKGVVVSHTNLLANQRAIQRALGTTERSRIGGWLPFHHDMGLIGQLLHPLFLGASAVLLAPLAFARRPLRWLQMIDRYGVTVSGAPDFAYQLCSRRVTEEQAAALDLSRWEVAVSGGECVRARTLEDFAARFAPAGLRATALRSGYGMAEATLMVAIGGRRPARTVDAGALAQNQVAPALPGKPSRTVVPVGPVAEGLDVLIVQPDSLRRLPDGQVGEIWLRGSSVAKGYWNRAQESAELFQAMPTGAGPGDAGGYLRTGDLGFLDEGELFVAGRLKEVLVVAGRNLHPQDIEQQVQRLSVMFGSAAAFAVGADQDEVVVVQEVRTGGRHAEEELPALAGAVQRCVAEEFGLAVEHVLLVRPGTVRRTTSGKLRRTAMRQLFLAGRIEPLHTAVGPQQRSAGQDREHGESRETAGGMAALISGG